MSKADLSTVRLQHAPIYKAGLSLELIDNSFNEKDGKIHNSLKGKGDSEVHVLLSG